MLAIIGAAKVSDKIKLLENILQTRSFLGGMAKTVSNYSQTVRHDILKFTVTFVLV